MPAMAAMTSDLRQRVLGDFGNVELRQKYLATRLPEWAAADLRHAHARLLLARLLRGTLGLTAVGAAGGLVGTLWLGPAAAVPVAVAAGSILCGAASFALLGAAGCVVLGEVVGEERPRWQGRGAPAVLGRFIDSLSEAGCGAIWGAICGLAMGLLAAGADALTGLQAQGAILTGAGGGLLLAMIFGVILVSSARKPAGRLARWWADLGPLPVSAYLATRNIARQRYLRRTLPAV